LKERPHVHSVRIERQLGEECLRQFLQVTFVGVLGAALMCGAPGAVAQSAKCKKIVAYIDVDWVSTPEFEQCAADGDTEAQALLGMMYWGASEDGGWAEDYGFDPDLTVDEMRARGLALLQGAAAKGNVAAMNEIGLAHFEAGYGFEQDFTAAREWLTRASDAGDAIAPFNLARIYFGGKGVPASAETAEAFLKLSASRDYRPGVCSLHVLTERKLAFASPIHRGYYALMRGANPGARCWAWEIMPELLEADQPQDAN
jgi:TPR repeat protein